MKSNLHSSAFKEKERAYPIQIKLEISISFIFERGSGVNTQIHNDSLLY